jgi:hypothetical protein
MCSDSLLLRQVHPRFFCKNELTSQAFLPSKKEGPKISVYDGDLIGPSDSYRHYTETCGLKSVGVWGIGKTEVTEVGLTSRPDPLPDSHAHALIDYGSVSYSESRRLAKQLMKLAATRGCLYCPA